MMVHALLGVLGLLAVTNAFQSTHAVIPSSRTLRSETNIEAVPGKRRKRRKSASNQEPFESDTKMATVSTDNATSLVIDEPGKLVGKPLADVRPKKRIRAGDEDKITLAKLRSNVESLGGKRPDDPSDAFDYGIGGLIKQTVLVLSGALITFDIYLNSPFFERAAPPPVVTAITSEISKFTSPPQNPEFDAPELD